MSQNQNKQWYFGIGAGLDFTTNPPTILTSSSMSVASITNEGTASIADATGNLLFYTDGVTIWNRSNAVMANGTGLFGHTSTSQAAMIVKQPGNTTIYFVFTLDQTFTANGLRYSTVDMSLAAGMGSVTVKNTLLYTSSTEKLCGVRHCNGTDIWVVSHEYMSNNFHANLINATGVNASGVISSIGTNIILGSNTQGCMKIAPSGKKLGLGIQSLSAGGANTGAFELYDFDNTTGMVSNYLNLGTTFPTAYGCEFSPDETKFYGAPRNGNLIYQWDLCAGSNVAISSSQQTIAATYAGQMLLAPDGKIYISRVGQTALGVINNPNASGNAINYNNNGQSIFPKISSEGLPNFVSAPVNIPPFTYTITPAISCGTATFTPPPSTSTLVGCSASGYSIANVAWSFGDPASGNNNTSTLFTPTHLFSLPGTYTTTLILYNPCGGVIDSLKQQVIINAVPVTSASGFSLCAGQTLTLSASGSLTYTWSTGDHGNAIVVTPAATTSYTVRATDTNGCINESVNTVTVISLPQLTITGATVICEGASITQTANGAINYTWSTGGNTPVITVTPTVTASYTVTGSNAGGCLNTAISTVTVNNLPQLALVGNTVICIGSTVTQTVSGAATYSWSTGSTNSVITLTPQHTANYFVTGIDLNGCMTTIGTTIVVNPLPFLTITGDNTVCSGSQITEIASGADTYSWNTGNTTGTLTLIPLTTTIYSVTGISVNGCVNTATTLITINQRPALHVSSDTICSNGYAILTAASASNSNVVYTWFPGAFVGYSIFASATSTQVYTVTAVDVNGCSATGMGTLNVRPDPYMQLGGFSYSPVCPSGSTVFPALSNTFNPGGAFFSADLDVNMSTGQLSTSQLSPGTHVVSYSLVLNGCIGTATTAISLLPAPDLMLSPVVHISTGSAATLQVTGGDNYLWTPAAYLSCVDCASPVASPPEDTRYCVSSVLGTCMSKACMDVIVSCETNNDFSVPNAFTPNGDYNNDELCLEGWNECITDFNVMIFNRWGEKVFESNNSSFCWDGIYKGRLLDAAVFVYVIRAKKYNVAAAIIKKGNITLIR